MIPGGVAHSPNLMHLSLPIHAALAAVLVVAVVFDIRWRRIPNRLVLVGLALALTLHAVGAVAGGKGSSGAMWWGPIAGSAAGFGLMLPLYLVRAMGAGDVKLMAMVGTFVGPVAAVSAVLYTLIAGGLLSLAFMLGRGVAVRTIANLRFMVIDCALRIAGGQRAQLPPLEKTAARLPYAVAIAVGTAAGINWPLSGV